jgi:hypothetical protein
MGYEDGWAPGAGLDAVAKRKIPAHTRTKSSTCATDPSFLGSVDRKASAENIHPSLEGTSQKVGWTRPCLYKYYLHQFMLFGQVTVFPILSQHLMQNPLIYFFRRLKTTFVNIVSSKADQ